jgi:glycosyltransferase involved in cell wall biosynthesis
MAQVRSIVQINTRDQRGGAEQVAWNLFQAYQARGRASWLVVGKKYSNNPQVWEIVNAPHAPTRWARTWLRWSEAFSPLRRRGVKGVGALQARLRWLTQPAVRQQRRQGYEDFAYPGTTALLDLLPTMPDLIHCHNLHGDYFDLTALPWLSRQRPGILHLHDAWPLSGHCAHALGCTRWQTGCGACPHLQTYPAIPRDNTAANWQRKRAIYADSRLYLVTVSQWLMDQVERSMVQSVHRQVIHNGIDLNIFKPGDRLAARRALGLPATAPIVLFSGHSAFKDMATTQQALTGVQAEGLLLLGLGQIKSAGPWGQGKLITPGYIQSVAQMVDYYRAADLYLHTATADSFPTTVLEAMACGTPVVATAVGGIPEQIQNGVTGVLTPPQAPHALAHAIQSLLADDDQRRRLGLAAAAHAQQYFGLARQVDALLAYYEEIHLDWQQHIGRTTSE